MLARAREIVAQYGVVIRREPDVGGYLGQGLEMPHVFADAETVEACAAATQEALLVTTAVLLEEGMTPPPPAGERRTEQVNVRLTVDERYRVEHAAERRGFRGVSDYVRTTILADAG